MDKYYSTKGTRRSPYLVSHFNTPITFPQRELVFVCDSWDTILRVSFRPRKTLMSEQLVQSLSQFEEQGGNLKYVYIYHSRLLHRRNLNTVFSVRTRRRKEDR